MRQVSYWAFPAAIRLNNGITVQTVSVGGSEGVTGIRVSDSGLVEIDFKTTTFVVGPTGGFGELAREEKAPAKR